MVVYHNKNSQIYYHHTISQEIHSLINIIYTVHFIFIFQEISYLDKLNQFIISPHNYHYHFINNSQSPTYFTMDYYYQYTMVFMYIYQQPMFFNYIYYYLLESINQSYILNNHYNFFSLYLEFIITMYQLVLIKSNMDCNHEHSLLAYISIITLFNLTLVFSFWVQYHS